MFLPHLTSFAIYYWTNAWQRGIYLFYITKKTTPDKAFFISKLEKPAFAHFGNHTHTKTILMSSIVYTK